MIIPCGARSRLALVSLALAAAVLSGAAMSQPAGGAGGSKDGEAGQAARFFAGQTASQTMASKLTGATVAGPGDKAVGAVTDLVISPEGVVEAAVIGVGGFLGVGEKKVAVPFSALQIVRGEDGKVEMVKLGLSREELERAQSFVTLAERKAKEKAGQPARENR